MRTPCKLAALLSVIVLCAQPVFADFGATIDNASSVTVQDESEFLQEDSLTLWASALLGPRLRFDASARATVSSEKPNLYADVERFTLSGDVPSAGPGVPGFTFDLGKFLQSDFTSAVLSQPTTGIRLGFAYPWTSLKLAFGYTGLNSADASPLVLSRLDALDEIDDEYFAAPRFIASAAWEFPELFARQTLTLSAVVQEDLRERFDSVIEEGDDVYDPTGGGKLDTQYAGLGLSGPLAPSLYYDLYVYLGTGRVLTFQDDDQSATGQAYLYEPVVSYLFGGSFRYFLPAFYKASAAAKFLYASGDSDHVGYLEGNTKGASTAFIPVADGPFGIAFTPKASNLMAAELSFSLKPFAASADSLLGSLQTVAKVTPYFKVVEGVMSDAAVDISADSGYLGTEVDAVANLRPYSDLGLGLSLGVFVPNGSMFVDGMDSPWFVGKLTFSFSF